MTPNREVSMSTSLLYHAFGIRGYEYVRTDYQGGEVIFTIQQDPDDLPLLGLRLPRGHLPRPRRAPLPLPAHRQPDDYRGPADPARRMSGLRAGAPGQGPLRRPQAELHQVLRAVRAGIVAEHDHPRRRPSPGRRLGHWSRTSRSATCRGASPSPSSSTCGPSPSTRSPWPRGTAI